MNTTNDYQTIKLWGARSGSMKYYIDAQVERARRDNAPANATYYSDITDKWSTVDDIMNIHTRPDMAEFLPYLTKKDEA